MDLSLFERKSDYEWALPRSGRMEAPGIVYAAADLIREMDSKVADQIRNVAALPGIVRAAYAMPDAHWGYGFPIGGVAAFDPDRGGVISAGGVGFDISCGVRTLLTGIEASQVEKVRIKLADTLFHNIPAGVGSTGSLRLKDSEMTSMLATGARWAVKMGYGNVEDLPRIENGGQAAQADPAEVSEQARKRQTDEMGTLGSGNHYLEVQVVAEVFDEAVATVFGLRRGEVVVSIHCGSRGLGHQVATEFSKKMVSAASQYGIELADRELACVPVKSAHGKAYLGAMRSAVNCALANRQILTHFVRQVFRKVLSREEMPLLYDVSHNVCGTEEHDVDGERKQLYIHRKGATRAFGPGHSDIAEDFRAVGQPVLVGGSMGTSSYVLAGTEASETLAFSSACHGAGRSLSRTQALKQFRGRDIVDRLERRNITIRTDSMRGIAEEAPLAYKDVGVVVESTERAGLARKVARLEPMICLKG